MNILGVSAFFHDSAAALVCDGKIVAAAQEERFSRKKNDADFPTEAFRWCLEQARAQGREVDYVAFYEKPFLKFERLIETYVALVPRGFLSFRTAMPEWISEKLFQKRSLIEDVAKIDPRLADPAKILFSEHHVSHAASAFYPSPFSEAAILTLDGVGEWATTSAGIGRGNDILLSKEIHFPHSLGLLYSAFTYHLGFEVNSDEYKVMGLAPYGEPVYAQKILDHLIDLKPDGSFRLALEYFDYCTGLAMTNASFDALFQRPPRKSGEPIERHHMDMAASVQAVLEEAVLRLTRALADETAMTNLCLAGGVALNCVANGKILRDGRFKNIWMQPAAGDAGGALGAALAAYHIHLGKQRPQQANPDGMQGTFLGPAYSDEQIRACLEAHGAVFREYAEEELYDKVVSALVGQKVVGWFQGRMEFGPRALGNRSILADARGPNMQQALNLRIKYRESFRPFAPAVLREDVAKYFELDCDSPYMLLTAPVRADRRLPERPEQRTGEAIQRLNVARSDIPAVTHVDYSARIQTVDVIHGRFHRLLRHMRQRTGSSVVVNTSFNIRDEPIVCTPEDALRCFLTTEMDMLVVGNAVLEKEVQLPPVDPAVAGDRLVPARLLATLRVSGDAKNDSIAREGAAFRNTKTGELFPDKDGVPSLFREIAADSGDVITQKVKAFYEEHPFPSYENNQDFGDLVNRGQKAAFTKDLLAAIGYNKLILECGCGTGQLSQYLTLNNNHVLGIDLSSSSLKLAIEHKLRNKLSHNAFVRMNIFDLAIKDEIFDVVISSGVLHSTKDPRRAFAAICRKAKPGGIVVLGLYNSYGRWPTWIRSKLVGLFGQNIDYVVRNRIRDQRKAEIWIKDQYYNPQETWHSIDEVLEWFDENSLSYVNCIPSILGTNEQGRHDLFAPASPGSKLIRILTQVKWLGSIASEGALFMMIGRKASPVKKPD